MLHLRSMRIGLVVILLSLVAFNASYSIAAAAPLAPTSQTQSQPNFGPNVLIFDPTMPTAQIQAAVDSIATQQVPNQFGAERYALLFKPGTYGTADAPLNFQVGYYTEVAGLGLSPKDVVINGSIYVRNQCDNGNCIALNNFWRSLSNLTINVTTPNFGCYAGEFWAVSQAAPMRRVNVTNGNVTLMDYCTGPSYASGGFIADTKAGTIINGSQQQFMVRNSNIGNWTNGVWNQVFSGVVGAPAQCFPADASCGGPYTTLATSPVTREKPFLYIDSSGKYNVFVPAPQTNSSGTTWESGTTPGKSLPLSNFFVVSPRVSAFEINVALALGKDILFTPGVYRLNNTIRVWRPDTVVLGLGFATLVPTKGDVTMAVAGVRGVKLAGLLFDAGAVNSPELLQIGYKDGYFGFDAKDNSNNAKNSFFDGISSDPADPTLLADVFFRIGGATAGKATSSLVINTDNVILDDIWAWRADHGNGVGWKSNTADTGLIVNGDNVTAYGLFVEHYQKYEVIWKGNKGTVIFFQNEMPYDVPSQTEWMEARDVKGWAAFKVANSVKKFSGYGMGSYSFFNQHVDIFADHAFEAPRTLPAGSLHDLLTIFLDATNGSGGILHVINDVGGSSTVANPDVPVTVVSYP